MHDKHLHINQKLDKNYLEPSIPADDAWASMHTMLDAEMTSPPSNKPNPKWGGGNHFGTFFISTLFVASFLFLWVNKKEFNKMERTSTLNNSSLLKKYNVKAIELGAQSLDDEVLKKVGRGHTTKDVETASKLINDFGFELGLQMMIGLPGDTELASIKTAQKIIELKAKSTRIYPTLVIKDTSLEKLYHKGQYKPLSLHDAIQITKKIIPIFENNKIQILRVGLHPSEGLITGKNLVAGPFHPSFKELVLTEIWYDKFTEHFKQDVKYKEIKIFVNPKEYNYAVGYRGKNKIYLSNLAKQVKFYPSEFIYNRNLQVEIIK